MNEPGSSTPDENLPVTSVPASEIEPEVDPQETELWIDLYNICAEWIRFADAKAAAVLTVDGAFGSVLIPTLRPYLDKDPALHPFPGWSGLIAIIFAAAMILLILSGIWAFLCIVPFRQKGAHPALETCSNFHPAAISDAYAIGETDRFIRDCDLQGAEGLRRQVYAGLLIDSHISSAKYSRVTRAIRFLGWSAVFGFLYLLAIQF